MHVDFKMSYWHIIILHSNNLSLTHMYVHPNIYAHTNQTNMIIWKVTIQLGIALYDTIVMDHIFFITLQYIPISLKFEQFFQGEKGVHDMSN